MGYKIRRTFTYGEFIEMANSPVDSKLGRMSQLGSEHVTVGTDSYQEAHELAEQGWPEGVEKIKVIVERIFETTRKALEEQGIRYALDGGAYVDVGRYCSGEPECFGVFDTVEKIRPIFKLEVCTNMAGNWGEKQIQNRGAAVLGMIDAVESVGYSAEVDLIVGSEQRKNTLIYKIRVKNAGEPLDMDRLAFCLMHPAFNRRISWSAREHEDDATRKAFRYHEGGAYGHPIDLPDEEKSDDACYVNSMNGYERRHFKTENDGAEWVKRQLKEQGLLRG